MGSEQGMGWNWITSLAKAGCEIFVISEGEYREQCEEVSKELPIHWYWNPVPQSTRDKCWNQGNWTFYPLYKKWQEKTAQIAREICQKDDIDILHQLNMIGFREPGCFAKVSKETGIPLVWGPIGGLKLFPMAFASGVKMKAFNWLKNTITKWQIKHDMRVLETLKQSSLLISSIPDSYNAIKRYHGLESVIIPETGCFIEDCEKFDCLESMQSEEVSDTLTLMWVGKFDFRKRLDIALRAIAAAANPNVVLKVFGTGSDKQVEDAKLMVKALGIEQCVQFMGQHRNDYVKAEMRGADAFLFTSVNEDTSTVVLEAVSNNLPVICFDCCGMAAVIDETVGIKIPLTNPDQSVKEFAKAIDRLYNDSSLLSTLSANCHKRAQGLSWDRKAEKMVELYNQTLITKL